MNYLKKEIKLLKSIRWNFSSKWIYTNKYEDIIHNTKIGRFAICPEVSDIQDVTLRMHTALMGADIILCESIKQTHNLLHSLKNKYSYIDQIHQQSTAIKLSQQTKPKLKQSEILLELSDHIKYIQEYAKISEQKLNFQKIRDEQDHIKIYRAKQAFRTKIEDFKLKNGFGYILDLSQVHQNQYLKFVTQGFNVTYVYPEATKYLSKVLSLIQQNEIRYEILPGPSELISTLVQSGFPADRFSLDCFISQLPKLKMIQLLNKRRQQIFSVCIMDKREHMEYIIKNLIKIYGEKQMIYIKYSIGNQNQSFRRQTLIDLITFLENSPLPNNTQKLLNFVLIVAPYSLSYNEQIKQKEFQLANIKQKMIDEDTPTFSLKPLQDKLNSLKQKKKYEINGIRAAKYLYELINQQPTTCRILSKLLNISNVQANQLLIQAKKLERDVLKISQMKRQ